MRLRWLANHQFPDGGWSFNHGLATSCHGACRDPGKLAEARNAATALALLPFLGSNNTHKESKSGYKSTVYKGLYFLINHMRSRPGRGRSERPGAGRHVFARTGHDRPVRSLRHDPRQEPLAARRGRP